MAEPDFTDKVAIVTGASRGIGRVIALGLAKRGATVVGTARNMDSSPGTGGTLRETFDMIEAAGGRGMAIAGSITESDAVNDLVSHVARELGRIDILVNNAGYHPGVSITEMTDEQWHAMIEVNINAVFFMTRAVVPVMRKQRSGNILGVSSGAGTRRPRADNTGYAGTKGFMDRSFFNLAHELKDDGIAVNTWSPGILATDMNAGRQPGEPVGVVEPSAMWLLSQTADTFTGQNVRREEFGEVWGPKL
jgi:NAD(P)-dependent dehydrogenase (short-subunit alcohol dehydrogenase family)